MAQTVKSPPAMQETVVQSQGQEYSLEKGMAILPWRIPWRGEPGGLHSPWGGKELDTTEQLTLSFFFSTFPVLDQKVPHPGKPLNPRKTRVTGHPNGIPNLISRGENRAANRAASPSVGLGPQSQM